MHRRYCFTINNPNRSDEELLYTLSPAPSYIIFSEERGESNTRHYQGYLEFKNPIRFSTIKNKIPRAHLETAKGTPRQARDYCVKQNQPIYEFGELSHQGKRTDLDNAREMAELGGLRFVTQNCQNYQQIKVAEKFLTYNEEKRDFKPKVIWIYGSPGSGKSRMAHKICGNEDVYVKNTANKWFDGYDGHDALILDDFRETWMKFTDLLSIIDRYERLLECKGGNRQIRAKLIVITSIYHPTTMYNLGDEPKEQLMRRISFCINKDLTITDEIEDFL